MGSFIFSSRAAFLRMKREVMSNSCSLPKGTGWNYFRLFLPLRSLQRRQHSVGTGFSNHHQALARGLPSSTLSHAQVCLAIVDRISCGLPIFPYYQHFCTQSSHNWNAPVAHKVLRYTTSFFCLRDLDVISGESFHRCST